MDEEYTIVYDENPAQSSWGIIGHGLQAYNTQQAGDDKPQRLCFVVKGPGETAAGGVLGVVFYDWLYIELLWLPAALRGRGYGRRLLMEIEEEGRRRGAKNAFLDTFSFQAPDFYKKHGYHVFGELADFPVGHTRYYLTKRLLQEPRG